MRSRKRRTHISHLHEENYQLGERSLSSLLRERLARAVSGAKADLSGTNPTLLVSYRALGHDLDLLDQQPRRKGTRGLAGLPEMIGTRRP